MIKGINIDLLVKNQTGKDAFNAPIYAEEWVEIKNVLIGEPTTEEVTSELNLSGKRIFYVLGIPKGDEHIWEDTRVRILGKEYRTIGYPMEGIEHNIPGPWHKKVRVERYGN